MSKLIVNKEYKEFLILAKSKIRSSQAKAALSVNASLIYLYWDLGKLIAEKQEAYSWGNGVIENLSVDLKNEFPDGAGFSAINLFNVRRFYLFYSNEKVLQLVAELNLLKVLQAVALLNTPVAESIDTDSDLIKVRQVAALIPWGHHLLILNKIKDHLAYLPYRGRVLSARPKFV